MKINKISVAVFVFSFMVSSSHLAEGANSVYTDQTMELLKTGQILTVAERKKFARFISGLDPSEYELSRLELISSEITKKVKRDKKNLNSILALLERLISNNYARRLGGINENDLKACQKRMQKFERSVEGVYKKVQLDQKRLNAQKYIRIIKRNSRSLVGGEQTVKSSDVWNLIKIRTKTAYKRWNKASVKLNENVTQGEREIYGLGRPQKEDVFYKYPNKIDLDIEEVNFLKDFAKIQILFRRLSRPNSPDF